MKLLDLFCGAGGAAAGYAAAGIADITGIDIAPQPNYPYPFVQADALEYLADCWREFDSIHASPPCQGYTQLRYLHPDRQYPMLIPALLERLQETGRLWVIENVMGARSVLPGPWLCGFSLGMPFARHRIFAVSFLWLAPGHLRHPRPTYVDRDAAKNGFSRWAAGAVSNLEGRQGISRRAAGGINAPGQSSVGHISQRDAAAAAMGIDWMKTTAELTQAVPPCYTHYMGRLLLAR